MTRMTRRSIGGVVIALLLAALVVPMLAHWQAPIPSTMTPRAAFETQREAVWVEGEGRVKRLLPDDDEGSRHQRFILALGDGQTLDRKSTRLNSSHMSESRMPSSA